jgi:hypothetical protein
MDKGLEAAKYGTAAVQYLQEHVVVCGLLAFALWSLLSFLIGVTRKRVRFDIIL